MERIRYMGMVDYRADYAVMAAEDRVRDGLRERTLLMQLRRKGVPPARDLEGRGRWSVARLTSRLVPGRDAGIGRGTQAAVRFVWGALRAQEERIDGDA